MMLEVVAKPTSWPFSLFMNDGLLLLLFSYLLIFGLIKGRIGLAVVICLLDEVIWVNVDVLNSICSVRLFVVPGKDATDTTSSLLNYNSITSNVLVKRFQIWRIVGDASGHLGGTLVYLLRPQHGAINVCGLSLRVRLTIAAYFACVSGAYWAKVCLT